MSDTRTQRHMAILRYIPQEPNSTSTSELIKKLEHDGFRVSMRMLQRDIEALCCQQPLCCDDSVRPHRWFRLKGTNNDVLSMTPSIALAIRMLQEQADVLLPQQVRDTFQTYINQATHKLSSLPDNPLNQWPSRIASLPVGFQLCQPTIENKVLDAVEQGIMQQKVLELNYQPRPPRFNKSYRINPIALVTRGTVYYLVATLYKSEHFRHFALHRIKQATITENPATTPDNFDLQDYIARGSLSFPISNQISLKLKVSYIEGYHLLETPLSHDQTVTYSDPNHFILQASVNHTAELRWWLMTVADISEVLEPAELRAEIRAGLQKAINHYQ